MKEVKRYAESCGEGGGVVESQNDEFVEFADYAALQQRLNEADQRIDDLKSALKFYADREHYYFESDNWDTVSGEPFNILWHGEDPDFIEDGEVARSALSQRTQGSQEVGS